MKKIEKEVRRLDIQLSEMYKSIERLKNIVLDNKTKKININYIETSALHSPLKNHVINKLGEELGYKYCGALASAVEITGNTEKKIKQLYFVFRIYHTVFSEKIGENLIRDAKLFSVDDWNTLFEGLTEDVKINFFVDMLLMCSYDKQTDEKQVEYFCELIALSGCKSVDIKKICNIVRTLLLMDKKDLLKLSKYIDVNPYLCYFVDDINYYVVSSLEKAKETDAKSVMIYGENFKDISEVVDLDTYGKEEITFENCYFENIEGIKNKSTKVYLLNCNFFDCRHENFLPRRQYSFGGFSDMKYDTETKQCYFLDMEMARIENTTFKKCNIEGFKNSSSVLQLKNCSMKRCQFLDCKIGIHAHSSANGSIVQAVGTYIERCVFKNCTAYGEGEYGRFDCFGMKIIESHGGSILNNIFEKCCCDAQDVSDKNFNNYIITYDKRCREENNKFIECEVSQCRYSDNFTHIMKALVRDK